MSTKVIAEMPASTFVGCLGWSLEDVALSPGTMVTLLNDGTVNALENGKLIANIAQLGPWEVHMLFFNRRAK
jgi:hypothetical protein